MTPSKKITAVLIAALMVVSAIPASAQYMFLDTDSDYQNTSADRLNPNGIQTTVDVWLLTDTNRDGSPAVCSTGDGTFRTNSYSVNLEAVDGTVTYGPATDNMGFSILAQPQLTDASFFTYGRVNFGGRDPGSYKLMSLPVTGVSGTPSLRIIGDTLLAPANPTSFGSDCSGIDADNTLKMCGNIGGGSDWCDTDGLGVALPLPDTVAPAAVTNLQAN